MRIYAELVEISDYGKLSWRRGQPFSGRRSGAGAPFVKEDDEKKKGNNRNYESLISNHFLSYLYWMNEEKQDDYYLYELQDRVSAKILQFHECEVKVLTFRRFKCVFMHHVM